MKIFSKKLFKKINISVRNLFLITSIILYSLILSNLCNIKSLCAAEDPWFGGSGVEIGGSLNAGYEPSGLVWHPRLEYAFMVGDDGDVTQIDYDGTIINSWFPGGDLEGITIADKESNYIYLGVEQPDAIREFDLSTGTLTGKTWQLTDWMTGPDNSGLEGLTFVPNGHHPYSPSSSGGLFYAGLQADGKIYVFDVDLSGSDVNHIDTITVVSGMSGISGLNYDVKTKILSAVFSSTSRYIKMKADGTVSGEYQLPGNNQEGVAVTPDGVIYIAEDVGPEVWRFDGDPPAISNINVFSIGESTVTICWHTDKPSDSSVEYGTDTSYGNVTNVDETLKTIHNVLLIGLDPDTGYSCRVISRDANGFRSVSSNKTFRTIPDSGTVSVSSTAELVNAVEQANLGGPNKILIEDGDYLLDGPLHIIADGITVRSASWNRSSVILRGQGMYSYDVSHVFFISGNHTAICDLTLKDVSNHAVQLDVDVDGVVLKNLHILDAYEQLVKIPYNNENLSLRSENGIMEDCLLEYSAGIGPQYYIGGIDGHNCRNWIVRNNIFRNIKSPGEDYAEHAIHFWSGSEDTLVEKNIIINCDRGIGFGLGDRGHIRGIIRNNMIYHDVSEGFADVSIGVESSPGTHIYNNTIYMENSYPNAIEYRFPSTTGVLIANNLTNKDITSRDGATGTVVSNITNAQSSWFTDVTTGNLHLVYNNPSVCDTGQYIDGLVDDIDGGERPEGSGYDIGADEYNSQGSEDNIAPSIPDGLSAKTETSKSVMLQWNASTDNVGVYGYRVYRNGSLTGNTTGTSYKDNNITLNNQYEYRIKAYDFSGNESDYSVSVNVSTIVANLSLASSGGEIISFTSQKNSEKYAANNLIDGKDKLAVTGAWSSEKKPDYPQKFVFKLSGQAELTNIVFRMKGIHDKTIWPEKIKIYTSKYYDRDFKRIKTVYLDSKNSKQSISISKSDTKVNYVKIKIFSNHGNRKFVRISEIKIKGVITGSSI